MQTPLARIPSLTLPEPLRAAEIPSFTHYSVVVRLPEIARRTLQDNTFSPEVTRRVEMLVDEIPDGRVRPAAGVPIRYGWDEYVQPYLGQNWLQIPWFFAEEYFYLRMLEACNYFNGALTPAHDPYTLQKRLSLETSRDPIHHIAKQTGHALELPQDEWRNSLKRLLLADLWGNQNDLSMWPVEQDEDGNTISGGSADPSSGTESADLSAALQHVLADDTTDLLSLFEGVEPKLSRVDIILDNAGYELVADLALADFLLGSGRADRIILHAKCYPVFVSDALVQDILATLDWLCLSAKQPEREMGTRLRLHLSSGRLQLSQHSFWTSPLAAWQMPEGLAHDLDNSNLLIWKGDANYRRLLGDRHWPIDTPFASVVSYFKAATLAMRTCKSEIAVGISPGSVPTSDETWMYNGKWGLIQFAAGK